MRRLGIARMNKTIKLVLASIALPLIVSTGSFPGSQEPLTARALVGRIQQNVGIPWQKQTVDTFKAGKPDAVVTGIVTTMFPTFRVLEAAAASGKNLIICHEPVFYDHFDQAADLVKDGDRVLADKKAFIDKNRLIVWRFHDHWHLRRPDGILQGMTRTLGWEKFQDSAVPEIFHLPQTRLVDLCRELKSRLGTEVVRVVGNPDMVLSTVSFLPGAPDSIEQMRSLARPEVDAAVIGETREWETLEYARDAVDEGKPKALIILGHVPSEESGMEECARWLRTFVTEVPIEYIPSGLPYWVVK